MKHRTLRLLLTILLIFNIISIGFVAIMNVMPCQFNCQADGNNEALDEGIDNNWSSPQKIVEHNISFSVGTPSPIAIDENGNWHLIFSDKIWHNENSTTSYIKYLNGNSAEPQIITNVTGKHERIGAPFIAIDSNGGLHVTYEYSRGPQPESIMYITKGALTSRTNIDDDGGGGLIPGFEALFLMTGMFIVIVILRKRDRSR